MEDLKIKSGVVAQPDKLTAGGFFMPAGITFLKEKLVNFFKNGYQQTDIRLISRGLIVCIVFLSVFFIFNFYRSWTGLKRAALMDLLVPSLPKQAGGARDISALKGMSYYIDGISKRDIFRIGGKLAEPEPASLKLAELIQTYRLVGISWSDDPDAMIEDSKMMTTYFVKKGQMIGEFLIYNILKDKVVLHYGKESIDLK